ncbi:MAG: FAD-dependent oxidoreductase, partial [Verrucomicrobiota bacterium]|nr:FAD-dependent oxidoreductase [Verrucomicrobiota bacterium]
FYEPSVAGRVFEQMLAEQEARLEFLRGRHLVSAQVQAGRVLSVTLETEPGKTTRFTARTFIDGTYEGDLAAAAGVPCRVGREGRDELGESKAGIHYMDWK